MYQQKLLLQKMILRERKRRNFKGLPENPKLKVRKSYGLNSKNPLELCRYSIVKETNEPD